MKRPIRIEGDVAYVPLTKGYEAVIDVAADPLVMALPDGPDYSGLADTPARAWLLAILSALIAQEGGK